MIIDYITKAQKIRLAHDVKKREREKKKLRRLCVIEMQTRTQSPERENFLELRLFLVLIAPCMGRRSHFKPFYM